MLCSICTEYPIKINKITRYDGQENTIKARLRRLENTLSSLEELNKKNKKNIVIDKNVLSGK